MNKTTEEYLNELENSPDTYSMKRTNWKEIKERRKELGLNNQPRVLLEEGAPLQVSQ